MSVTLSPSSQLGFQRPLTQLVKRSLAVSNHNSQAVAYKVKTTAPKQYCVRPNSGRIEPGETVEVQVLLQPMKEDPAPGAKCRDKFLVQSIIITSEREDVPLAELWSVVEQEDKSRGEAAQSQIFEQKIRCAYLPAAEHGSIPEETTSHDTPRSSHADPAFASAVSPSSRASTTPTQSSAAATTTDTPSPTQFHNTSSPAPAPALADKARDAAAGAAGAAAGAAAAVGLPGVANAIERNAPIQSSGGPAYLSASAPAPALSSSTTTSHTATSASTTGAGAGSDELSRLRSELASTNAELARVKQQLDASETTAATLRSRGAGAGGAGTGAAGKEASTAQAVVELKGQEGVPVQVVAGLMFAAVCVTFHAREPAESGRELFDIRVPRFQPPSDLVRRTSQPSFSNPEPFVERSSESRQASAARIKRAKLAAAKKAKRAATAHDEGQRLLKRHVDEVNAREGVSKRDLERRALFARTLKRYRCGTDKVCAKAVTSPSDVPTNGRVFCNSVTHLCTVGCQPGFILAGGICLPTEPKCGENVCGTTANGVFLCSGDNVCTLVCDLDAVASGGQCVDVVSSPTNCGTVGNVCPPSYNGIGTPQCRNRNCILNCPPGSYMRRTTAGTALYCYGPPTTT
ncbi:hypothetical protein JCM9279_000219 [Rhodotorula babjevae]